MSTRIAFVLRDLHIRSSTVAGLNMESKTTWTVQNGGTILAYCATEGQANRVKRKLDELGALILTGALDEDIDEEKGR